MNIILYQDSLFNINELYNEVVYNNFIDGFMINVSMTKDKKIIVYNFNVDINIYDLKENTFMELNEFLNIFKGYKKKIIINLLGYKDLSINPNINEEFVKIFESIIINYTQLDLYVCSVYNDIITFIIRYLNNVKKGIVVAKGNLNYYDVDFYLTSSNMFDIRIIEQQIKLNKEIILILKDVESIVNIVNELQKKEYLFNDKSLNLLYISTTTPKIVKTYFNNSNILFLSDS